MTNLERLHYLLSACCPMAGVSVADWNDKATWTVHYLNADEQQRAQAAQVIANFDPSPEALEAWIVLRRREIAAQMLLRDATEESLGARATSQAVWMRLNDIAEATHACLVLICQRGGLAHPSSAEIITQITANRLSLGQNFPYPSPTQVADQGLRRLTENEIMGLIGVVIGAGMADPLAD